MTAGPPACSVPSGFPKVTQTHAVLPGTILPANSFTLSLGPGTRGCLASEPHSNRFSGGRRAAASSGTGIGHSARATAQESPAGSVHPTSFSLFGRKCPHSPVTTGVPAQRTGTRTASTRGAAVPRGPSGSPHTRLGAPPPSPLQVPLSSQLGPQEHMSQCPHDMALGRPCAHTELPGGPCPSQGGGRRAAPAQGRHPGEGCRHRAPPRRPAARGRAPISSPLPATSRGPSPHSRFMGGSPQTPFRKPPPALGDLQPFCENPNHRS